MKVRGVVVLVMFVVMVVVISGPIIVKLGVMMTKPWLAFTALLSVGVVIP